MAIDPFKRALIITAIQFNQPDGSIFVNGLTPEAAEALQSALRAELNVGANISRFSFKEHQGMTLLTIYPRDNGRFPDMPSFTLLLGECLGMYLDINSFSDVWKAYVNKLRKMMT
jgi:hypothetical protein